MVPARRRGVKARVHYTRRSFIWRAGSPRLAVVAHLVPTRGLNQSSSRLDCMMRNREPLVRAKQLMVVFLPAVVAIAAVWYALRWTPSVIQTPPRVLDNAQETSAGGYADPAICATCHDQIAGTFSRTGMGRSFSRVRPDAAWLNQTSRLYHEASDRYYTMLERDGRFYQRRHEIGFDGNETNVVELEAHYVVGSGNHAQTFLHRNPDGRLLQMPVSWYAERGRVLGDEPRLRPSRPSGFPSAHQCRVHDVP